VPVSDDQVDLGLGSIAFSPSNPQIVYAGMGDVYYGSFLGTGVLKSTDGGNTWSRINNQTLPTPGITSKIAVDLLDPNRVYLAQNAGRAPDGNVYSSGFWLSTDGGVSWTQTLPGLATDLALHPTDPMVLYLSMARVDRSGNPSPGLYRSTDRGNSWTFLTGGSFDAGNFPSFYIGTTPGNPQLIYLSARGSIGGVPAFRILVSADGGATWTDRGANTLETFGSRYIAVDPANTNTLYIGQYDLIKSTDGGVTWTNLSRDKIHVDQHAFAFSPVNSNLIYLGHDGGLSRSVNGGATFESLNSTLSLVQFYGLTLHPTNSLITYGGTQDNGTQKRLLNGIQWRAISGADGGPCVLDTANPSTVFVSFQGGGIWRFRNNGDTFDSVVASPETFGESINRRIAFIPPFTGNGVDSKLYFGSWRLFISNNLGASWSPPAGTLDLTKGGTDVLSTIGVARSNINVIYTGSSQGRAMVSNDGGSSWNDVTAGLPNRSITNISVDASNAAAAYLTVSGYGSGHVFKTTNSGTSWTNVSGNLPDIPTNALLIDPTNPNIIYVGTDIGVFRSTVGGTVWESFNSGMPPAAVFAFAAQPNGLIRLGTYGRGAYELTPAVPTTIQFASTSYSVNESAGSVSLVLSRTGDTLSPTTISYSSSDTAATNNCNVVDGRASSRCDYATLVGTVRFAPGETAKTISVLVVDDRYAEGNEQFNLTLSNAVGATLGTPSTATVTINDNDTVTSVNPLNQPGFFVRQHYLDFFSRESDPSGLGFWTDQITSCGSDSACIELRRINVSAAFFLSIEFRQTGYLVYRMYKAAYGNVPGGVVPLRFNEFLPDTQEIGLGVVVGQAGWEQLLETNKNLFAANFVSRARFTGEHPTTLSPTQLVNALFANAGVTPSASDLQAAIGEFGVGAINTLDTSARGRALRRVAENSALERAEFNRAFVLAQYFGYLRRNPDDAPDNNLDGYNFWLNKLNQFDGNFINAEMVKAFITSGEYRQRFGP
jgi:photosystem II stability/assembly factor-like uncharacterized protein